MKSAVFVRRGLALFMCAVMMFATPALAFAEGSEENDAVPSDAVEMDGIDISDIGTVPEPAPSASEEGFYLAFPGRRYYSYAFEVLRLTNQERAKNGLPALKMDADLLEGAMVRGAESVIMFSHYRPNDSWCFTVAEGALAENIAAGQRSPQQVVEGWMDSPGHRANILGSYTTAGMGCFLYNGILYWVQLFGTGSASSDCAKPSDITQSWQVDLPFDTVYDQYFGKKVDFHFHVTPGALSLQEGEVSTVDLYAHCNTDQFLYCEVKFDRDSVGWMTEDAGVASVDGKANVKGIAPGAAVLYARSDSDPEKMRFPIPVTVFRRLAGSNRYETAILAAGQLKEDLGTDLFDNIVIASGKDYADALAGAYLAGVKNAPILLVNDATITRVAGYASANLKPGGTVYILGGTGAVPDSMESALSGVNVKRLAGSNRYLTNIEILKESGVAGGEILVCSGRSFPDALSASAVGLPILLTGAGVTPDQLDYLETVSPERYYLVGGTAAVTSAVENTLAGTGASVERVAGLNRYSTSTAVAKKFFTNAITNVVLAFADNFPDGLAGGPVAHAMGAPLILIKHGSVKEAGNNLSTTNAACAYVLGGKTLIMNEDVGRAVWGYE